MTEPNTGSTESNTVAETGATRQFGSADLGTGVGGTPVPTNPILGEQDRQTQPGLASSSALGPHPPPPHSMEKNPSLTDQESTTDVGGMTAFSGAGDHKTSSGLGGIPDRGTVAGVGTLTPGEPGGVNLSGPSGTQEGPT